VQAQKYSWAEIVAANHVALPARVTSTSRVQAVV